MALHGSVQENTELLRKSLSACAIMGALTLVADVSFCTLWAREVSGHDKARSVIF